MPSVRQIAESQHESLRGTTPHLNGSSEDAWKAGLPFARPAFAPHLRPPESGRPEGTAPLPFPRVRQLSKSPTRLRRVETASWRRPVLDTDDPARALGCPKPFESSPMRFLSARRPFSSSRRPSSVPGAFGSFPSGHLSCPAAFRLPESASSVPGRPSRVPAAHPSLPRRHPAL